MFINLHTEVYLLINHTIAHILCWLIYILPFINIFNALKAIEYVKLF